MLVSGCIPNNDAIVVVNEQNNRDSLRCSEVKIAIYMANLRHQNQYDASAELRVMSGVNFPSLIFVNSADQGNRHKNEL